jgi:hypothetical protein
MRSSQPRAARWRPQFEAALAKLAEVSADLDARGFRPPILVGGAAVELYTQSAINTGDFDLVTAQQPELEAVLIEHGFVRPAGPGVATRGWIHPELALGFEVVGSRLLDGLADRDMVRIITIDDHGDIAVIAIEDVIADRMGQYASGTAHEMLGQARALFRLSQRLDHDYMERRIREETAQAYGIPDLQTQT